MRRLVVLAVAVVALASVPAAAMALPQIDVECNRSPTCEGVWFTSPVFVDWSVSGETSVSGCVDTTIDTDTTGSPQGCTAYGSGTSTATVIIQLDQTPPVITRADAVRPPDYSGWYNHPVTFIPQATDETSKVASCDAPSYSGPDNANATVVASCRDKAGNTASRAFPLRYDATPPDLGTATVTAGDHRLRLHWSPGSTATLSRIPGIDGATSDVLYQGPGSGFTDKRVRNGKRYRYILTLTDEAGNSARRELNGVPRRQLLAPAKRASLGGPPLLTWTPVRRARYYNVQVFRNGHKILSVWPRKAELQLKREWRFHGKRRRLKPGLYRWYVWPGLGPRKKHRYGRLIGRRAFTIDPVRATAR